MSVANSFKFVLLPPQSDITRDWGKRLAETVPEARVIVAEDADIAAREIVDAEAAFGWLGNGLCQTQRNCGGYRRHRPPPPPATTTPSSSRIPWR